MITKTNNRWGVASTGRKVEISARKPRTHSSTPFAVLQPRRPEYLPTAIVAILRALSCNESDLIVFASKEETLGLRH